ncbi:B3 domain-containing transcription factor VRN1 isoform X1 [Vigna radiata var. radiata]|uniref:B3 domain-containing transcription factor VRN1 isoform X1 n=1 Tax=Vigna radiata var. radiata TaxID=3916 RepID=A0A1S3V0Z0_VIGRR|nr:B3 domain-containing transcription factor VRN1 isoform X1 [Vigna radiata var. radiata]
MSSGDGNVIHFFKKIDEDALRNGDLRIPRSFVSKYWQDISNPLHLLLPKGAEWEVKWRKVGADIWLIDKWKKFSEFYSLDENYILMFKYVGMSLFEVVILRQTGLEIMYPLKEATLDNAENGNGHSPLHFKKTKSSLPRCRFLKKVKTNCRNPPNISEDVANRSGPSRSIKEELIEQHANGFHSTKFQKRGTKRKPSECSFSTRSDTAMERAESFRSENPFFIRKMQRSYIQRDMMVLPNSFITEDEEDEHDGVTLWTSESRPWHVEFYRNNTSNQINFTIGWKDFVKDNNLRLGDVCVFEKIKKSGISFKVIIFRDREESSSPRFSDHSIPECKERKLENHFSVCIKPKDFNSVNLPRNFLKNHGICDSNAVILEVGKKSWNVKLDSHFRFTTGWGQFIRMCHVKPGDVCRFELIDKKNTKIVFQVTIVICIK